MEERGILLDVPSLQTVKAPEPDGEDSCRYGRSHRRTRRERVFAGRVRVSPRQIRSIFARNVVVVVQCQRQLFEVVLARHAFGSFTNLYQKFDRCLG